MNTIHTMPFEGADKTYDWNGEPFIVEDWWDRLYGESWAWSANNPAALDSECPACRAESAAADRQAEQ